MNSVRILGGRAGRLLPVICGEIGRSHQNGAHAVLLVPEQYTLQAERELVSRLSLPGMLDMEVLSPTRLRRKIRERGGQDPLPPLNARGLSMALCQSLLDLREELSFYRGVADRPGLPEQLAVVLQDLADAGLTPETLRQQAKTSVRADTAAKLKDLSLIWNSVETLISGRFADEAAQNADAVRRLPLSGVLTGAEVWVYGFDLLNEGFCRLLTVAAECAAALTVAMTMDQEDAPDGRLFRAQRRSALRLAEVLAERGISCRTEWLPASPLTDREPALRHLEQALFTRRDLCWTDPGPLPIALHAAPNPLAEAEYAAGVLTGWHRAGIPWGRMAVAAASPISHSFSSAMRAAGVPFYIAQRQSVLSHGLCRMLTGALGAAGRGWRTEDIMTFAHSGYAPLSWQEICRLENYARENGIDRNKWKKPFTRGNGAETAEPLRAKLMEPLEALHDRLAAARSAAATVEAVWLFLEDAKAYQTLQSAESRLIREGCQAEASVNRQVWKVILDLLDQLHALLGGRRGTLQDISQLIRSGLSGVTISALPAHQDMVMSGDAGHLMTGELDALLVVGMQDGALASSARSLLDGQELELLSGAAGCRIGLSQEEQSAMRLNDFYRTLTMPRRFLTISWQQASLSGEAARPASLIDDLRRIFPGLQVTGGSADQAPEAPVSPVSSMDALAVRLREAADGRAPLPEGPWRQAVSWLGRSTAYRPLLEQIRDGLTAAVVPVRLDRERALRLYGSRRLSISRLETFAACPYQHFVQYGLQPVEQREFAFQADERGTFFHAALAGFAERAAGENGWPEIGDDRINQLMDEVLEPLIGQWKDGPLAEDPCSGLTAEGLVRTVKRAARLYARQLRGGQFVTLGAEIPFGTPDAELPPLQLRLEDGHTVALQGKIDRIDLCEDDAGRILVRVIDYKSSQPELEPEKVRQGIQLQLPLYLRVASAGIPSGRPAGTFYMTVRDKLVSTDETDPDRIREAIGRTGQLNGWMVGEPEIIRRMETDGKGAIVPNPLKADGTIKSRADACTAVQMENVLDAAEQTAARLAEELRGGMIGPAPVETETWSPCSWCGLRAVCRLDPALPGGRPRMLDRIPKKDFFEDPAGLRAGADTDETRA